MHPPFAVPFERSVRVAFHGGIIGGIVMAMAGPSRRLGVTWLAMIGAFGLEVMALGFAPILPIAVVVNAVFFEQSNSRHTAIDGR